METDNEQLQKALEAITGQALPPATPLQLLREHLAAYLNDLILHNQHQLIFLLYRIDLNEKHIKQLLQQQHDNSGLLLADLVIEKQLGKIALRRQFKQDSSAIPEEDRW